MTIKIKMLLFFFLIDPTYSFFRNKNFNDPCNNNILDNMRKRTPDKYNIIDKSNDILYENNELLKNNKFINKKVISISPGGLQGFYLVGIVNYIKDNYKLDNYIFTGASAGAWSSLLMSYKYDTNKIINCILEINKLDIQSIFDLQLNLKKKMLLSFRSNDFDLTNIFIGVTVLKNLELSTNIFYNFKNLEDAIDCCIASSHIPLLTGGLINKYNNEISFDGGFSNYPYLNLNNTVLHLNPNIWNHNHHNLLDYSDLIQKLNDVNFYDLYNEGYNDTKKNKDKLDLIFKDTKI